MFRIWLLVVAGASGDFVRLKFQRTGVERTVAPSRCLQVASEEISSVRQEGTTIDAWDCDAVRSSADHDSKDLSDMWRIDPHGLLISHISGLCLEATPTETKQVQCSPSTDKWMYESAQLKSLSNPGQCLGPHEVEGDVISSTVVLQPCAALEGLVTLTMEASTLVVYPPPTESFYSSPDYAVSVEQNQQKYNSFVGYTVPKSTDPDDLQGKSNSFTTFSFDGSVTVYVTKLSGPLYQKIVVRPASAEVQPQRINSTTISFKLSSPNVKLSVEFDDEWKTKALLIFADPLEVDIPAMFENGVIYLGVGEHQVNENLGSGQEVYIAGGAYVYGSHANRDIFSTSQSSTGNKNIKIRGRGVISGKMSKNKAPYLINLCGSNHEVEGVTLIDPPQQSNLQVNAPWYCDGEWSGVATGAHVHNVKLMGWNFADGIYAGKGSHVHHSFTRVNDDGVKPFEGDTLFEDNVHWQMGNGWAIMLSWITEDKQGNITVRRSTVIHDDHHNDWAVSGCDPCVSNQATLGIVHGGAGTLHDIVLEDIVMETSVWRPLWFGIDKNTWASEGTGVVDGIQIRNLQILMPGKYRSAIMGSQQAGQMQNIAFSNLQYNGKVVSSLSDAQIDVTGKTSGISIVGAVPTSIAV